MRVFGVVLCGILVLGFCGVVASLHGQAAGQAGRGAGTSPNSQVLTGSSEPAPADRVIGWPAAEIKAIGQELLTTKVPAAEHRFFRQQNYNMEVRRLMGPQPILLHSKKGDLMVIQDGEGTFMSGGQLVNGVEQGEDPGDMRGDSIRGGVTRVVKPGDVVWVPAGLPHAFVETKPHVTFLLVRFWTR